MKIIHTADNHLDMPLSYLSMEKAYERKKERLMSFSKIIDYTIFKKADALLIAGDLFDTPSPSEAVLSFCRKEFPRLGNIPVIISSGNHDWDIKKHSFPDNVHVFTEDFSSISLPSGTIYGISFPGKSAQLSSHILPPKDKSNVNILCIHGDLFSKSEHNFLNKNELLNLGYDYIALGHIHQSYISPHLAYPGCHDGGGFDEGGVKGFLECDVDKSGTDIKFIPSSSRVYETIEIDISDFSSSEEIVQSVINSMEDNLYKIVLTGTPKEGFVPNEEYIEFSLSMKAFFVKVSSQFSHFSDVSNSALFTLFEEYISSEANEKIREKATKYASMALRGEDIL